MIRPFDLLEKQIDKKVYIQLKSGTVISGTFKSFDIHINLWLEDSIINLNETKLGQVFIRGESVVLISPGELRG